jgi:DNA modification methylase
MKLGPYTLGYNDEPECGIYTGDAKLLSEAIPDESVDLIFADPVYDRIEDYEWLAETATRVLKPGCSVLAFCPHVMFESAIAFKRAGLELNPLLEHYNPGALGRMFKYRLQMNLIPCLWASKGRAVSKWQFLQALSIASGARGHLWGKAHGMIFYRMQKFTDDSAIVFDPFTGGGTVPAVCKQLNRSYLAFEIEPETAVLARERVRNTQPPLFVLDAEQQAMEL